MKTVSPVWMFATLGLGILVVGQFIWWDRKAPEVLRGSLKY